MVNDDQVVDGVGVVQPTCAIIHDECVRESEEELTVKDDSLPFAPHLLYPDIQCDSATLDFPCENSSPNVSISDHSQDTLDVSVSLHCREDMSSSKNLSHLSFGISENTKGEHPCFSFTPLCDSSNHEDTDEHFEFSDHGCRDLCTSSFDHDVDSLVVNLPKPLVSDNLSIDEVKTPQVVEALQPKMIDMPSPHYPEVSSTSNQKNFETPKAPHHFLLHIEDQPNTQISLPPPKSHDPIAHALEESYTANTLARHKLHLFLMFACLSQSRECACLSSTRSVSQHHVKSAKCLSCAFTLFFSVDVLELGACWSLLINLSSSLVYMHIFHAFSNMG